jgi:hypothetical protein
MRHDIVVRLAVAAMGFQDRLEQAKNVQAEAARAHAHAETQARAGRLATAQSRAKTMLPELAEAVNALRADKERSGRQLMAYGGPEDRYSGIIAAILTTIQEEEPGSRRWWRPPRVHNRRCLAGWWVRYRSSLNAQFEFEVPLDGQPLIGRYHNGQSTPKKWTFEEFARDGLHEYTVGGREYGPTEVKEITADEVFRDFLKVVNEHLVYLPD